MASAPRRRAPVVIAGAGFSGTILAAQLARRGIASVLIDSGERAGLGTAFSTADPAHLLNIPAEAMGAWPEQPADFAERENVPAGSYAERRLFGRYLRSILAEAVACGHVEVVDGRAVEAKAAEGRWLVTTDRGTEIDGSALVLAIGNQPPASLAQAEAAGDLLIRDPWGKRARDAIDDVATRQADVLIIGTSLTMIDIALSLESAGHKGQTVALSRRGKLPLSNGTDPPAAVEWEEVLPPRVRDIAAWLRRRSRSVGWRPAVDSLRPHSHRLWQSLDGEQRRLFLRHGRPWWDIHRHRIAPEIAERLDRLQAGSRLEVVAGRLTEVRPDGEGLEVTIRRRGEEKADPPRRFGYIFNCTGPLHDIGRTRDPLLRQLLDDGLAYADELGIGLSVDGRARLQGAGRLWALGALTKGRYWEMIAVPDIRDQAAQMAADIATELGDEPDA